MAPTLPPPAQNKALYRDYIEQVFNQGRLDRLPDFLHPAYVYQDAPPGTPPGLDSVRQVVTLFRSAFPDLHITIEDQIAEADQVCSRAKTEGTHRGPIFGVAGTGRRITMRGLTLVRIREGRILESWVKNDVAALMKQIGAGA